ncbi:hypothetical protein C1645_825479 [Glomus cerebriforme]|uniref:Uncharacterized protein n=1 Tax=Glomus cerebriforme TaxID=658196 RepID=A0A397T1D8_9GLOM|nr:hypothetical protein C1645_825479 [Glomus cerebriforme]
MVKKTFIDRLRLFYQKVKISRFRKGVPENIYCHADWDEYPGQFKTPTALLYDDKYMNIQSWGFPTLAKRPTIRRKETIDKKPVELFKLHLEKISNKPSLPTELDF